MAKPNRNTNTRLATTINARYFVSSGASDTFYLDGRLSGKRERRAADITLDREDRGFFLSVFAHTGSQPTDEIQAARLRKSLDKILHDVKNNGRNIDAEINELAECAVDISGRMTLQNNSVRQPYFAGIIVKDAEIAAITMGGGCAWLYRGDVLYPLTSDDCQLDAIDLNGKDVPGHDVYCAGVAGTVRYSNIAQLQEDDCVITCNKDVFEALGQREILRLLYEAEDQADASGLIITAASAKMPGVPLQFMIGFVEAITAVDKPAKAGFGRSFAGIGAAALPKSAPAAKSAAASAPRKEVQADLPEEYLDTSSDYEASMDSGYVDMPSDAVPYAPVSSADDDYGLTDDDGYDIHEDEYYEEYDNSGRTRRIAFYLILAVICIVCLFALYQMLFGDKDEPKVTTTTPAITTTTTGEDTTTTTEATTTESTTENTDETTTAPEETTTEPEETTTAPEETTTAPDETTTAETTAAPSGDLIATHKVVSGETLFGIAVKYYESGSQANIDLIKNANGMTSDVVQVGDELKIPVKN
ncbi:MAG: LysM peptidoglycan-binding domain-containing protein [Clostridiaceae bacterium]|nr:LysM peptidoglycan-binding domain-containing protein [Clostridiaceae bacterium]